MKLAVFSHKECWPAPGAPAGWATVGGFPLQMEALSELFEATELVVTHRAAPPPASPAALRGRNLRVTALPEPPGRGWRRKAALAWWLPRHLPRLLAALRRADAVHAPVPGDLGLLGLLLALAAGKPLFVRHCGTWDNRRTAADRFLARLLPRVAGGRRVVLATGGGEAPPCPANPEVGWIFATSLRRDELEVLPAAPRWRAGEPLRLVTVAHLIPQKNTAAALEALPEIRRRRPGASLDVVGDGPCRGELEARAAELGLGEAVTFHGNLSHAGVMAVLGGCHLFVFPTRVAEGFPKAVLEALARGLPVAAPPVSVIPHLLAGGGGRPLAGTEGAEVARAVLAMTQDPEALAAMAAAARDTARGYTLERWRDAIGERLERAWGPLAGGVA